MIIKKWGAFVREMKEWLGRILFLISNILLTLRRTTFIETLSLIGHKDCLNSVETEGLMNCTSGNFYKKDYNRKQCANWELNAHCLSPITLYGSSFKTEASFSCLCLSSILCQTQCTWGIYCKVCMYSQSIILTFLFLW